jgi:nucleotide-binding universal stress UspA family protein
MKTILVPVDLSRATTRVCDAACALTKLIGARIVLFNVVQLPVMLLNDVYALDAGALAETAVAGEKFAARKLRALGRRCEKRRVRVQTVQRTGEPVTEILARAAAEKAAYLVLGSHGHGAAYDLLVGSTTQGVLRGALCPVLVVPLPRH